MALYLGSSDKLKLYLNGMGYRLNIGTVMPAMTKVWLLSSDDYMLTDSDGVYLLSTASVVKEVNLLSSDDYMLIDSNRVYLLSKDGDY